MKTYKKIYIEITNVCNLNCPFCPKSTRPPMFMDKRLFVKILQEIKGYTKYLYFHVLGEPLLHPLLGDFIDLAYQNGFLVNLTTNGTLLTKVKADNLLRDGLRQINISLHSWNSHCTEELDSYLKDIICFVQMASVKKPNLYLNLRLWNLNSSKEYSTINHLIINRLTQSLNLDSNLSFIDLAPGQSITLKPNLFLSSDIEFIWPSLEGKSYGSNGYCYGLKNHLAILVDGTVIPCCLDREGIINLGNLMEKSFGELLANPRAEKIIQNFKNRKVVEPLCQRCDFRQRFD